MGVWGVIIEIIFTLIPSFNYSYNYPFYHLFWRKYQLNDGCVKFREKYKEYAFTVSNTLIDDTFISPALLQWAI